MRSSFLFFGSALLAMPHRISSGHSTLAATGPHRQASRRRCPEHGYCRGRGTRRMRGK